MAIEKGKDLPMINCHTHIFTGAHVPPFIAKTFLPWPFYFFFPVSGLLRICKFWYVSKYSPRQWKYKSWHKKMKRLHSAYRSFILRHRISRILVAALNLIISYHAVCYFADWLMGFFVKTDADTGNIILRIIKWLTEHNLLYIVAPDWLKVTIFLFTLFFISIGRKLILLVWKKMWRFLSLLPDKKTLQFAARYINIGRFAYYSNQWRILVKLKDQYPAGTGFVLLPMDMEFMDAGKLKPTGRYGEQMRELAVIKQNRRYKDIVFPFVFVDPRRKLVDDQLFFDWEPGANGTVVLKDCFIKTYMEEKQFSGFKIYPALGYYPFDEALLPLWKYAADNRIPILTHCIRGTIFYRGRKEKAWDKHPVFKQADGQDKHSPLLLSETRNIDFCNNFTHPLNYLCLVDEKLLQVLIGRAKNPDVKKLFGYNEANGTITSNLKNLKLCFGHFGGEDEWQHYFDKDRDNYTSQLVKQPDKGIEFTKIGGIENSYNTLERVWKGVDWYSIISSMMLQYENLYADLSYIIHDKRIYALLKQTLANPELKKKVLFGTDFYVVRNHKSEKEMLANMQEMLTAEELDQIAKINPREFLNINMPLNT